MQHVVLLHVLLWQQRGVAHTRHVLLWNMGRYRRKKMHVNDKTQKKKYRTRRRTKDLDQIQDDMLPENASRLTNQPVDPDLPGEGRYYCLHCSWVWNKTKLDFKTTLICKYTIFLYRRYFIDGKTMTKHFSSKLHKRRCGLNKYIRVPL